MLFNVRKPLLRRTAMVHPPNEMDRIQSCIFDICNLSLLLGKDTIETKVTK